ncbi:MAG: hypothetical protein BGO98_29620 [Myxococcales bacterium 68-20]|mgnify:FL=1|nr:MAG: hypothetical protein BGO98_29620 [Myxococcales bacterium 68-20]
MEVSLPQDVADALQARADQTGEARSAIVAEALRRHLDLWPQLLASLEAMLDQPLPEDPAEKLAVLQNRFSLANGALRAALATAGQLTESIRAYQEASK